MLLYNRNGNVVFAFQPSGAKFDFVKPGAHLGALGCVVHDVDNSATS